MKYVLGEVDLETRREIARERKRVGSPVHEWFEKTFCMFNDPLNVDWLALALFDDDTGDQSNVEGDSLASDDDVSLPEDAEPFEVPLESFDPATAAYLQMELSELRSELRKSRHSPVYRSDDDVLAPYRADLRRLIRADWNWSEQRNNPSYQDERALVAELAKLIEKSTLSLPFPILLVATVLVREGLDELCDPFR